MNYDAATNKEINRAIEKILHPLADGTLTPNYCDSPSDACPIIVENKISVFDTGENIYGWAASSNIFNFYSNQEQLHQFDKNPLRAAMIVFLKLKESEK